MSTVTKIMEVDIDFVELLLTSADCLSLWSDCNIAHIFLSIHVPAKRWESNDHQTSSYSSIFYKRSLHTKQVRHRPSNLISSKLDQGTYGKINGYPARHHRQCYCGGWRWHPVKSGEKQVKIVKNILNLFYFYLGLSYMTIHFYDS